MNLQIQIQGSPQQTPKSKQLFQTSVDANESPFLSPRNDSMTRRNYRVRTYKPKSLQGGEQFTKTIKSRNYISNNNNECVKCKSEKSTSAIKLCHCLDIYYHKICILEYAEQFPKLGIELFRCQFCNEYFPLKLQEKLSFSNLTKNEKIFFLIILPSMLIMIIFEISLIAALKIDLIYFVLLLILILLELLIVLITLSKLYHLSYLIEYDIMEYKIGQDCDQIVLENSVLKVVKQLQHHRAKRIVIDSLD